MPNKRDGWYPKESVYEAGKALTSNPQKIDARQNDMRTLPRFRESNRVSFNSDGDIGNRMIRKKTGKDSYVDAVTKRKLNKVQKDLRKRK